jgi:hypothetical protein
MNKLLVFLILFFATVPAYGQNAASSWPFFRLADQTGNKPINNTNPLPVSVISGGSLSTNATIVNPLTGSGNLRISLEEASIPLPVTGTFWQATQPISAVSLPLPTGAAAASQFPAALVSGRLDVNVGNTPTVTVSNFPATQPVSGTVTANAGTGVFTVNGSGFTQPISGSVSITGTPTVSVSNFPATQAVTQSGTWTVQPGNTANTTPWLTTINQGGNSATVSGAGALKVDGSAVTQPVSGSVTVSGTTTVSGTVTANIGTTGGLALDTTLTGGTQKTKLVDSGGVNVASINGSGALLVTTTGGGSAAVYSATSGIFAPAALATTDIFIISGSATKTVRILYVGCTITQNVAAVKEVRLVKRSTANSGGTASAATKVPFDSTSAASTVATCQSYTANPTLGTTVGNISTVQFIAPDNSLSNTICDLTLFDSQMSTSNPIILRGVAENLAVNFGGVALGTGPATTVTVVWSEE